MNNDVARLARWLQRAQPPRAALVGALVAGLLATATNVALFVGAIALLVESATRPGLRAVALVLIVIELFAFLRSPLRFRERLSAHRLGYAAVTHWRRWLVESVGCLDFSTWRTYASGDLLERALADTDELQDLWLRFVVPVVDTLAVLVVGDVVVAVLAPFGRWWVYALLLVLFQVAAVLGLSLLARSELALDRQLRDARGFYRGQLVELSAVTPELTLLGRTSLAEERSRDAVTHVSLAERALRRRDRASSALVLVAALLSIGAVATHPRTSSVWLVAALVIGLATYEALVSVRGAFRAAVEVSGGGERLDALATATRVASKPWPGDHTLHLHEASIVEDGRELVHRASLQIEPGSRVALVGESGVGKSTLLRAMAALDEFTSGTFSVGDTLIRDVDEADLRRHLAYVMSEPGLTRGFALDVVRVGRTSSRDALGDLRALGLASERATRFDDLSRGERARVALARALVSSPDVYLLDELTAGLGRDETDQVLSLLASTSATVVVATHDENVIAWCDVVVELRQSELTVLTR